MKKVNPIVSIFFHNYYGHDEEWMAFFSQELTLPFHLFYNGVSDSYNRLRQGSNLLKLKEQASTTYLNELIVRASTNKGKDIGGKLALMDAYLKLEAKSDYILLLHDKQSPYHANNEQWKKELFRIAEKEYQEKVIKIFRTNKQAGIVASANAIKNELDNEQKSNAYTDSALIKTLKENYNIHPPHLQYVAGTMFWVRAGIFEDFFKVYSPLLIRSQMEEGNVTDNEQPTYAHAWERLLCWLVTAQGYQIKGV